MIAAARISKSTRTVFDPAAGEGGLVIAAARKAKGRVEVFGGDTDASALCIARSRFYVEGFSESLVRESVNSLTSRRFDDVLADVVLLDPPADPKQQRLDEWMRLAFAHVKPGGRAVVALPAHVIVNVSAARRLPDARVVRLREELEGIGSISAVVVLPRSARSDVTGPMLILVLDRVAAPLSSTLVVRPVISAAQMRDEYQARLLASVLELKLEHGGGSLVDVPVGVDIVVDTVDSADGAGLIDAIQDAVDLAEAGGTGRSMSADMIQLESVDFSPIARVVMSAPRLTKQAPLQARHAMLSSSSADDFGEDDDALYDQLIDAIAPLKSTDQARYQRAMELIRRLRGE